MSEGATLGLVALGALAAGFAVHDGKFYTTGRQWYESCWAKTQGGKASDPYQDAKWSTCEPIASRAFFGAGLMFGGGPADGDAKRLASVCPSSWTDLYLTGNHVLAVKLVQSKGGPGPFDGFVPAEWMLNRAFSDRWPHCRAEADKQGYPWIIEKTPGVYGWERPCPPHLPCEKN